MTESKIFHGYINYTDRYTLPFDPNGIPAVPLELSASCLPLPLPSLPSRGNNQSKIYPPIHIPVVWFYTAILGVFTLSVVCTSILTSNYVDNMDSGWSIFLSLPSSFLKLISPWNFSQILFPSPLPSPECSCSLPSSKLSSHLILQLQHRQCCPSDYISFQLFTKDTVPSITPTTPFPFLGSIPKILF